MNKQSYGFTFQQEPYVGKSYRIPYPFCRTTYTDYSKEKNGVTGVEADTWRPGTDFKTFIDSYGEPDCDSIADKMGAMLVTIIDIHKPGTYPERVFYIRKWETPEGKIFGKTNLRITTTQAFLRLIKGYRHEFEIVE